MGAPPVPSARPPSTPATTSASSPAQAFCFRVILRRTCRPGAPTSSILLPSASNWLIGSVGVNAASSECN
eukprot:398079-Prorocentrum_lima.AAC.1